MITVLTALAGGLGGALRFLVDTGVSRRVRSSVPLGTIAVNATACLVLGVLVGGLGHVGGDGLRTVLVVGLLGGYSTFSTAAVEGARLLREGRWWAGLVHGGSMLVLSLATSAVGFVVGDTVVIDTP